MRSRHFAIPAMEPRAAEDEMYRFCSANRIVACERRFVNGELRSHWAVCVALADEPGPLPDTLKTHDGRSGSRSDRVARRAAVDYKALLDPAGLALFAKLQLWRKAVAEAEGVPLYTVFTNKQLAAGATTRAGKLTALGEIEGVEPARLDRYGPQISSMWPRTTTPRPTTNMPLRMLVDQGKSPPRHARRLLEQLRQARAFRQPQRERSRQRQQQRGLSLVPELDATCAVDAARAWTSPRVMQPPGESVEANRKASGVLVGVVVDAALRTFPGWPIRYVRVVTVLGVRTRSAARAP